MPAVLCPMPTVTCCQNSSYERLRWQLMSQGVYYMRKQIDNVEISSFSGMQIPWGIFFTIILLRNLWIWGVHVHRLSSSAHIIILKTVCETTGVTLQFGWYIISQTAVNLVHFNSFWPDHQLFPQWKRVSDTAWTSFTTWLISPERHWSV